MKLRGDVSNTRGILHYVDQHDEFSSCVLPHGTHDLGLATREMRIVISYGRALVKGQMLYTTRQAIIKRGERAIVDVREAAPACILIFYGNKILSSTFFLPFENIITTDEARRFLQKLGIRTIGQLVQKSAAEIYKADTFCWGWLPGHLYPGIKDDMQKHNLRFDMDELAMMAWTVEEELKKQKI